MKSIEKGEVSDEGIDLPMALGGHSGGVANLDFQGSPVENARLAARRLNARGKGETAAGAYAPEYGRANRKKKYNDLAPKFQKFFDCLKNN